MDILTVAASQLLVPVADVAGVVVLVEEQEGEGVGEDVGMGVRVTGGERSPIQCNNRCQNQSKMSLSFHHVEGEGCEQIHSVYAHSG